MLPFTLNHWCGSSGTEIRVWAKGQRKEGVFIVRDITQAWFGEGKWSSWSGVEEHDWDAQTLVTLHKVSTIKIKINQLC